MSDYPIALAPSQLRTARAGGRTHVCMPAFIRSSQRLSIINGESPYTGQTFMASAYQRLRPGDLLWVQEEVAVAYDHKSPLNSRTEFRIDTKTGRAMIPGSGAKRGRWSTKTIGAANMARDDSRYTLAVVAARVFPCQEITGEEIQRETPNHIGVSARSGFRAWWDANYGLLFPWDKNPKVVGIDFEFRAESVNGIPAPIPGAPDADRVARSESIAAYMDTQFGKAQPKASDDGDA